MSQELQNVVNKAITLLVRAEISDLIELDEIREFTSEISLYFNLIQLKQINVRYRVFYCDFELIDFEAETVTHFTLKELINYITMLEVQND